MVAVSGRGCCTSLLYQRALRPIEARPYAIWSVWVWLRNTSTRRHNNMVGTGDTGGSEGRDLLPRVIADAAAAAAGVPFGPAGPFITAATTPYLELLAQSAWDKFGEDAKNRIFAMLGRAWHATGLSSLKFAKRIGRNERTRLLTATAMTGAATTSWPPRVAAIGKLLASGLIADDEDELDLVALALGAMAEMDRPHVTLLDLLVNFAPNFTVASSEAQPYRQPLEGTGWSVGRRVWTAAQISTVRPQLKPALPGLIGTLVRHGLAVENNEAAAALVEIVRGFEHRAQQQARQIRAGSTLTAASLQPHIPQVPNVVQTWSPTERGEEVLMFYREAAGINEAAASDSN